MYSHKTMPKDPKFDQDLRLTVNNRNQSLWQLGKKYQRRKKNNQNKSKGFFTIVMENPTRMK